MDRLRPQAVAVLGGQLLELELEDLRSAAPPRGRTSSTVTGRPSSSAIVVNRASSSPQAVIQSVNGAGSRSTLSA